MRWRRGICSRTVTSQGHGRAQAIIEINQDNKELLESLTEKLPYEKWLKKIECKEYSKANNISGKWEKLEMA